MKVKTRMKTEIVLTDKEREILRKALKITTDIYAICDDAGADRETHFQERDVATQSKRTKWNGFVNT